MNDTVTLPFYNMELFGIAILSARNEWANLAHSFLDDKIPPGDGGAATSRTSDPASSYPCQQ